MTAREALAQAERRLAAAGVETPRVDAEWLVAHLLGTTRSGLAAHLDDEVDGLEPLLARREAREPLAYVLGEWGFRRLTLKTDARALVPRPETETLVEAALRVASGARRILDVCTGSGAVAAVLARELPGAAVVASDLDADALVVAGENVLRHAPAVALVRGDLLAAFRDGAFDLVVANPPYVAEARFPDLMPEVRDHEPRVALAAGADGLALLRRIVAEAPRVLSPGGWLVMEMSAGHAPALRRIVEEMERYSRVEVDRDHAGVDRVLAAQVGRGAWRRS